MSENRVVSYWKSLWPPQEKNRKKFSTQKMVIIAVLIALHVVLAKVATIPIGNSMKITMSGITEVVAGFLFGPISGGLVGLLGSFLDQMLSYGFTATTLLWILPAALKGLICGWYAKANRYEMNPIQILWVLVVTAVIVTAVNTVTMIIDATMFGYATQAAELSMLGLRVLSGALTSVAYMLIVVPLLHRLKALNGIKDLRE